MSGVEQKLPGGWQSTTLRDIAEIVGGVTKDAKKALAQDFREVPYLRVANVQRGRIDLSEVKSISASEADIQKLKLLPGDILLNEGGDRDKLGRGWIWQGQLPLCIHQNHVFRARLASRDIDPVYVAHFTNSMAQAYFAEQGSQTTNLASISLTKLGALPIWLPPAAEQTRIVAKLEELLSDLNAGVAELKAAQKKLAQYRQSLLKAAVEGSLTAEWRAARLAPLSPCGRGAGGEGTTASACEPPLPNPSPTRGEGQNPAHAHTETPLPPRGGGVGGEGVPTETGEQLLQRILQERRARWEAKQLAKFKDQGKTPPKDWQKKYPEPVQPDTSGLPELPQGWVWATTEVVGDVLLGRQRAPQYLTGRWTRPYLRVANIKDDRIDFSDVETMDFDDAHFDKYRLNAGDILVSEGQSPELVGQSAIFRGYEQPLCFQKTLHRFRAAPDVVLPEFAQLVFRTNVYTGVFRAVASITTNIAHLTLEKFEVVRFPLPPLDEQAKIVDEVDTLLANIATLERSVTTSLRQSTAQRQNILRAAFAGLLVPQDPADEPASVLLERIRAERAEHAPAKKPRGRQPKETA